MNSDSNGSDSNGNVRPPQLVGEAGLQEQAPDASRVLVVVPALNEDRSIGACLASILSDEWSQDTQIVVIDGGSTDQTREIVTRMIDNHPNLILADNPARLQSAGINAAVKQFAKAETQFIVRCDAHAIYPPRYVRRIVQSLIAHPNAAAVATPMDAIGDSCFSRAAAWIVDTKLGSGGSAHRGGQTSQWVDHGHHAGFRAEWFEKIGGYDESFSHNEDAEFDLRLGLAGGKIWLDADIRLDYQMRRSARALARQYWNYGRGRARTVAKHRIKPRLRQMIPPINVVVLTASFIAVLFVPAVLIIPVGYITLLVAVSLIGIVKLRLLCGLWSGVALGVIHNAWGLGFLYQSVQERRR